MKEVDEYYKKVRLVLAELGFSEEKMATSNLLNYVVHYLVHEPNKSFVIIRDLLVLVEQTQTT